ncbi:MAG: AMP-binding protein [Rectinemataceae bacterium]
MYELERFTIPEIVEKSSSCYSGLPALATAGKPPITYDELEPMTRRVAALLVLLGAAPGHRVAILAESSPEWGIAYFGISRAACVVVPILTDFTSEQVAAILDHSESHILFVSRRNLAKAGQAAEGRVLVTLEDLRPVSAPPGFPLPDSSAVERAMASLALPEVTSEDLAAIVYTSGTTGSPKGVMLSQRNIVHDGWSIRFIMLIGPKDRLLSILPMAHTYEFTVGFIYPMMQGSSIYYLDRPPSSSALMPALKALRPTTMLTVPLIIEKVYRSSIKPSLEKIPLYPMQAFRPFLERIAGAKLKRTFGGRLRIFGIGGAPLAADVAAFLHRIRFPCALGYGLTETAPLAAGSGPYDFRVDTIGPAIHGSAVRIADPLPGTGEGEIQIRGPNVMVGYYKDPDRTAQAFTEDGWFRTGDLGVMDAEGRIAVRGRLKTMILGPSGKNIYPEEVEAVLNSSPFVQESLVYGDDAGLTALVQLKPETAAAETMMESVAHYAEASLDSAEKALAALLERIKKETNARLSAFSRINIVRLQLEPFEKTPTQKIKRFLYPRSDGNT